MSTDRMTREQRAVTARVMAEEGAKRRHLVVHLSGAHAYGFPSQDSDLDLKALHVVPTREMLGFRHEEKTFNRLEFVDGVEVDYTSNELQRGLLNLLSGDGNMLERVTSRAPVLADPWLEELAALVPGVLSRRYHRHYRGFAGNQRRRFLEAEAPSAKKLLYVLRTALTGTHLLLEQECQPDLTELHERYGFPEVPELVELKQAAEKGSLADSWASRCEPLMQRAFDHLEQALEHSPLPEEPGGRNELEDWLIDVRRRGL